MGKQLTMFYLISYDVVQDKRRNDMAKALKNYGTRVQYSVFECLLTANQFDNLLWELRRLIDPGTDSLRCYRLCHGCLEEIVLAGQGEVTRVVDVYIL